MLARPAIVLIGSPLLGPSVWAPVQKRLRAAGWDAGTLQLLADHRPPAAGAILIGHSNAGAYIPALALNCRATALVFVDAILPGRSGSTRLAPAAAMSQLASLSDAEGILPRWTKWWDESDVARLFPDDQTRRLIEAEQPRLPLTYFENSIDAPEGWDACSCAYLSFGDTYDTERLEAAGRGWRTRTLDGQHLHMIVNPDAVTETLLELIDELTLS